MAPGERFFCATAARSRGDSMVGTAPHGTVWVLIEYRGGWPVNGFDGLDLEPSTKALVRSTAEAARARILLIRRHGRRTPASSRNRWAVLRYANSGAHQQSWGTWGRGEDLAQIAAALRLSPSPGDGGLGVAACPPLLLVCAHGRHDPCCAVRGRPVGRALSERWPELVWECSHVGGDRFAPNVVVLPDGVYYGGLDAEDATTVVAEHLAGRIDGRYLRGYTDLFPPQQAAVAAVLARFGPAGRRDYAVVGTVREEDRWLVRITGRPPGPAALEVEVRAHRTPPHRMTCRGPADGRAVAYRVTSVSLR
ncbi:sucrase ferredoxin [Streptomyces sp. NPDC058045]|uniref:sucrase ferredoxin n=1 Tax=Streptomyces sp. NPDC058045 TaxID=3346311 RepID=UPI0036E10B47